MIVGVYAIQGEVDRDIDLGMALKAPNRVREHNIGKNRYTERTDPCKIVLIEAYQDWASARARERYLKSGVRKEEVLSTIGTERFATMLSLIRLKKPTSLMPVRVGVQECPPIQFLRKPAQLKRTALSLSAIE